MFKKAAYILMILPVIIALAACSSVQAAGTQSTASTTQGQSSQAGQAQTPPDQPLESKLAVGTLKLEGTAQAVTADQARTLLPLWKAAKSLSSSSTASSTEVTALYQQIQDAMSAEQVQAIKDLKMTQADNQALMQQYGVEMPQPGSMPTLSADQQATMQARRAANRGSGAGSGSNGGASSGAFPGGDFGGGMPPDGGPGGPGMGASGQGTGTGNASGQANAQQTPAPGQNGRGFRGGMNTLFIDPLIKVLEERAGVSSGS